MLIKQNCAGDVLQALVCKCTADLGAALRVVRQLLRSAQRHPERQRQHAGWTLFVLNFVTGTWLTCKHQSADLRMLDALYLSRFLI